MNKKEGAEQRSTKTLATQRRDYLNKIEETYSYNLALRLETYKTNPVLGYRTAGSQAEFLTGELLAEEMKTIGLQEVCKDEFAVDSWEFEKARLSFVNKSGYKIHFELGGYQVNFDTDGAKPFQMVYCGKGTAADYKGIDVEGKLVLIDLNQRDDWWINYPAYEAHKRGAAAVLAAQSEGYGEIDPDALNAQNICGPADAPVFSISKRDADFLKRAIDASPNSCAAVEFDAKSLVKRDKVSYNIVGKIPGRDANSMILLTAHYDSYFSGFQDDNAAVGQLLGIAKGLLESGYQPEKTWVFCAMAAEEWGVSNSKYDWSVGAYKQVFKIHPDWAGKVVGNLNFELPAYSHDSSALIRSVYEFKSFLLEFKKVVPEVEGVYPGGIQVICPVQAWADDFSIALSGIPSLRNDFAGSFMEEYYHSQFDNKNTYDEKCFRYHHNLYGLLAMEFDHCAVAPLDFSTRLEALAEAVGEEAKTCLLYDAMEQEILATIPVCGRSFERARIANVQYREALDNDHRATADWLLKKNSAYHRGLLKLFRTMEDELVALNWYDDVIFPHEGPQHNLHNLDLAIQALQTGDVKAAVENYLSEVDNNAHALAFCKEVCDYFTDYAINQPPDRLNWGRGRLCGQVDLFDVIQALTIKEKMGITDFAQEIECLELAKKKQKKQLEACMKKETLAVEALCQGLENLLKIEESFA